MENDSSRDGVASHPRGFPASEALSGVRQEVLQSIRQTLIEQETAYQNASEGVECASLWMHSLRVAKIARYIAAAEGLSTEPAMLAGRLHDIGKFGGGSYHEDETAEEETAVQLTGSILDGTSHSEWIPVINEAILSLYREGRNGNDIGRVLYDADRLDKLGCMGVAQFFAKNALRRHFLDNDTLVQAGIELTYAYHAPDTLKTRTGRKLAKERGDRTRSFYKNLILEWEEVGLGGFRVQEEDIAGIVFVLVVPLACDCGNRLGVSSDIRDSVKCRSAEVRYLCPACGMKNEFSFCLPNVKGLPGRWESGQL